MKSNTYVIYVIYIQHIFNIYFDYNVIIVKMSNRIYTFKKTADVKYWEKQLKQIGKKITKKDIAILKSIKEEVKDNKAIARINDRAAKDNLYIPELSGLEGNCMFESLEIGGLGADSKTIRESVGSIFYFFGDYPMILGNTNTLKELFSFINDVEYVFCREKQKLYKYSYYTMCADLFTEGCWSRLPAEMILSVIASCYGVRIHIYHDNQNVNIICPDDISKNIPLDDDDRNIYLGLLGEHHYIPLVKSKRKLTSPKKSLKYSDAREIFMNWATNIADKVGLYEDDTDTDEN